MGLKLKKLDYVFRETLYIFYYIFYVSLVMKLDALYIFYLFLGEPRTDQYDCVISYLISLKMKQNIVELYYVFKIKK